MSQTKVVNINIASLRARGYDSLEDWLADPNHVYIGRSVRYVPGANKSKWANPFGKKKYGHAQCVQMFEEYIREQPLLLSDIEELRGKELGCWCKPAICHGDILIKLLQEKADDTN